MFPLPPVLLLAELGNPLPHMIVPFIALPRHLPFSLLPLLRDCRKAHVNNSDLYRQWKLSWLGHSAALIRTFGLFQLFPVVSVSALEVDGRGTACEDLEGMWMKTGEVDEPQLRCKILVRVVVVPALFPKMSVPAWELGVFLLPVCGGMMLAYVAVVVP